MTRTTLTFRMPTLRLVGTLLILASLAGLPTGAWAEFRIGVWQPGGHIGGQPFEPVPRYAFDFRGFEEGDGGIRFVAGYGIQWCLRTIFGTDHALLENDVEALRAVIGGRSVEFSDALTPTSTSSSLGAR